MYLLSWKMYALCIQTTTISIFIIKCEFFLNFIWSEETPGFMFWVEETTNFMNLGYNDYENCWYRVRGTWYRYKSFESRAAYATGTVRSVVRRVRVKPGSINRESNGYGIQITDVWPRARSGHQDWTETYERDIERNVNDRYEKVFSLYILGTDRIRLN